MDKNCPKILCGQTAELQNNALLRRLTNCHTVKDRKPIPTTLSM
jgi:hypothetical protein